MTRLTRAAACRGLLALGQILSLPLVPAFADGVSANRFTVAPADPTMAPDEPRDMTKPRAVRRALRARLRDRVAPEAPSQTPRDLTATPQNHPGLERRLEAQRRKELENQAPVPAPRQAVQEPIAQQPQPFPAGTTKTPQPSVAATVVSDIRLAQVDSPDAVTPPPTSPDESLPADEVRVRTLNKPLRQIGLVEPEDTAGLRPADLAAELSPGGTPHLISGSYFALAHPSRYLYCFAHNPLYFEEANLERCGIGHGVCQPAVSAASFIGRTALLPYSLLVTPPCSCVTTLGDCPTCHAYPHGADLNR
ncbi:hypothetical protein Pan44_01210 [Caulifigura coniformis]|uniref:Uncharacterized protein n=1 Tax=Caulifigura coniformis TaxID=2527983 RepID=A0A517S7L1_9PLAN|nr:hypothetical protein [Caulifigura coniformis]QDT52112.1 hypothetical protein Pan44_01210 [Caulifigura coniformis]